MEEKSVVDITWFITGYHVFKFRPDKNEELNLYKEKKNPVDPWAIMVRTKSGKNVGRVPANLCRLLRLLKDVKKADNFKCRFTNTVFRVKNHTKQFKRNIPFDIAGGGAVLSCQYSFTCLKRDLDDIKKYAQANIPEEELHRFIYQD